MRIRVCLGIVLGLLGTVRLVHTSSVLVDPASGKVEEVFCSPSLRLHSLPAPVPSLNWTGWSPSVTVVDPLFSVVVVLTTPKNSPLRLVSSVIVATVLDMHCKL